MTCAQFTSYGDNRQYVVSPADITGMSDSEFMECVEEIGTTPGFDASHWEAAAIKAIKVLMVWSKFNKQITII
jgi:hypothetical protein